MEDHNVLNQQMLVISSTNVYNTNQNGGRLQVTNTETNVQPIFKLEKVPSNNSRSQGSSGMSGGKSSCNDNSCGNELP